MCMDTISPEEVARRLEKPGYTEEAERIEKIFSEVPLYSQSLHSMKALEPLKKISIWVINKIE